MVHDLAREFGVPHPQNVNRTQVKQTKVDRWSPEWDSVSDCAGLGTDD